MSELQTIFIPGPAGQLETLVDVPTTPVRAIAICGHPHPLMGGTMHHKTIYTISRAFVDLHCIAVRFNFRGVQKSEGQYDYANGEVDDMASVYTWARETYPHLPVILSGFSFGSVIALNLLKRLEDQQEKILRVVVAGVGCSHFSCTFPNQTPSVIIHGEKDDIVPLDVFLNWAAMPPETSHPVIVVPLSDHFFSQRLAILKKIITDSFQGFPL